MPVGRPRTTRLMTIDDDLQSLNFGVHTAWRKARDRDVWHQVVSTASYGNASLWSSPIKKRSYIVQPRCLWCFSALGARCKVPNTKSNELYCTFLQTAMLNKNDRNVAKFRWILMPKYISRRAVCEGRCLISANPLKSGEEQRAVEMQPMVGGRCSDWYWCWMDSLLASAAAASLAIARHRSTTASSQSRRTVKPVTPSPTEWTGPVQFSLSTSAASSDAQL